MLSKTLFFTQFLSVDVYEEGRGLKCMAVYLEFRIGSESHVEKLGEGAEWV